MGQNDPQGVLSVLKACITEENVFPSTTFNILEIAQTRPFSASCFCSARVMLFLWEPRAVSRYNVLAGGSCRP